MGDGEGDDGLSKFMADSRLRRITSAHFAAEFERRAGASRWNIFADPAGEGRMNRGSQLETTEWNTPTRCYENRSR